MTVHLAIDMGKNLKKFNLNSDKYEWLCERVIAHQMPRTSVLHRHMLTVRKFENKLNNLNLNINLSGWIERVANL